MSRELKFRAYDKVNSKMLDGVIPVKIQKDQPYMIWGNGMNYLGTYGEQYTMETFIQLGQFEIMQYTGLKDSKGHEIYEGDILSDPKATYEVRWKDEISAFTLIRLETGDDMRGFGCYDFSVVNDFIRGSHLIGNIYETPELLKP